MTDSAKIRQCLLVLAALMVIVSGPAQAAKMITTNEGGGTADPAPGSTADTGWNPQVSCLVVPGESIDGLLACLAVGIDPTYSCHGSDPSPVGTGGSSGPVDFARTTNPGTTYCPEARGDYRVTRLSYLPGIEIVRWTSDETFSIEPKSLFIRENDPNIQWTRIEVGRPGLIARIQAIADQPSGGSVEVTLNGRTASVPTTGRMRSWNVTQALLSAIRGIGFAARYEAPFIIVLEDLSNGTSLTQVGFRSLDHAIVWSEIHLDPPSVLDLYALPLE